MLSYVTRAASIDQARNRPQVNRVHGLAASVNLALYSLRAAGLDPNSSTVVYSEEEVIGT